MKLKNKYAIKTVIIMCVIFTVGCAIRPMPEYEKNPTLAKVDGTIKAPGLNGEVKIYRDNYGVPHIFTENEHDLFFANGYVQAQDRLWEITFFRAIATGRLSEMFGNVGMPTRDIMGMKISTFEMDRRMRIMGMKYIGEAGAVLLKETQPDVYNQMEAFCDGLNAFSSQNQDRLPIEFQVLHIDAPVFTVPDIIALSRFYGSMLCANMDEELARHALIEKYGVEMAWKLMPLHDSPGPTIVPKEMLHNRLSSPKALTPGGSPDPALTGLSAEAAVKLASFDKAAKAASLFSKKWASNNWVVGPKITATGTAMLANDPHLLHIEPSLCYVMHLKGAGYDAYGVVFPGQPFIVMGHSRDLSWGATVTGADVQDLFIETVNPDNPNQYKYKGEWKDFVVRKETIKIRPGIIQTGPDKRMKEKEITIRHSIHGPIINDMVGDLPKGTAPIALRWVGWDFSRDPKMFEAFVQASGKEDFMRLIKEHGVTGDDVINVGIMFATWMKAKSIDDFVEGMKYNVLLNMNWVAADSKGNIAYLPGGLVPLRKKGLGTFPVPGEDGEYDWEGFLPLMEHPHAINPDRGWMVTANNEVVDAEWYPHVFANSYAEGWRAWRIEELIEELKPITVEDMKRIQNDVYVKQADVFVPMIVLAVENKNVTDMRTLKAAKILKEWNREATIDSAGAAIFYDTISNFTDNVLKDDFDKKDYAKLVKYPAGHAVSNWLINGNEEFMDNKKTRGKVEDKDDIFVESLEDAVKWLSKELGPDMEKWQWGQLHTLKWYHPMGFGPLKEMSIGPFPHPGGNNTVRNASSVGIPGGNKYMCMGGPVLRHVMDMGDPDNAQVVIDGSQSGQWLSPHYNDMHTLFYNSQYMTAEKRPAKIIEAAESVLTLTP
jgi:penicillin G amidase